MLASSQNHSGHTATYTDSCISAKVLNPKFGEVSLPRCHLDTRGWKLG